MAKQSGRPSGHRNVGPVRRTAGKVLLSMAAITLLAGTYLTYQAVRFNRVARTASAVVARTETTERPAISKTHSGRGRTVSGYVEEITLTVRFRTDRGTTVRTRIETSSTELFGATSASLLPWDTPTGDGTILVLYDPDRPERARLSEYRDVWSGFQISLLAALSFFIFGQIALRGIYLNQR